MFINQGVNYYNLDQVYRIRFYDPYERSDGTIIPRKMELSFSVRGPQDHDYIESISISADDPDLYNKVNKYLLKDVIYSEKST